MATTVHDTPFVGRPPKYKPEYCQMLIDHMATGMSYETFAATIGTYRSVLYDWEKKYQEFSDAKKIAVEACQAFWEKIGMAQAVGDKHYGKGSTASWIFNMKNRFNWTDRQEVGQIGENEKKFKLAYNVNDDNTIEGEVVRPKLEEPKKTDE